jgi:TonB family protein
MINYGEFISIDPFIEDGLSKHYDLGRIYSMGNYKNGFLSGKWTYHTIGTYIDTVDYSFVETYFHVLKDSCKEKQPTASDALTTIEVLKMKENIQTFIKQNMHYPARARDAKESFDINVNFELDTNGYIICPEITNCNNIDFTYEILRVLFLYKSDSKILNPINLSIPIYYIQEPAFVFVEEQASFQGGTLDNFREWVQNNLVVPRKGPKKDFIGRVTVQFAVNSKGDVTDVKIVRGVKPSMDKEVYRVIMSSPRWKAAKHGGRFVRQQFIMPVIFE